jgi:hypothetical protein
MPIHSLTTSLHDNENGQTATEYVAVLVVAVGLAIGVLWVFLSGLVIDVVSEVGSNLSSFSNSTFGG